MNIQESLQTRVGPLPLWGWGVALAGMVGGLLLLKRRGSSAPQQLPIDSSLIGAGYGASGSVGGGPTTIVPSGGIIPPTPIAAPIPGEPLRGTRPGEDYYWTGYQWQPLPGQGGTDIYGNPIAPTTPTRTPPTYTRGTVGDNYYLTTNPNIGPSTTQGVQLFTPTGGLIPPRPLGGYYWDGTTWRAGNSANAPMVDRFGNKVAI